tara:strand:+ start:188 stop:1072 length:885 start_codon:yes stop_codon:yes gene_type:complete
MLTRYLYYSFIITFSFLFSFKEKFDTEIGKCHLNIENSNNNLDLKNQIKFSAQSLVKQFGPVSKNDFYINIISNKNKIKKFPDWASGVAIGSQVFIHHNKLSSTVLNHELCHIYQHKIKNSNTFPSWFKEGMAMYFSKDFFDKEITILSESILLDYVIELDKLHNISNLKNIKEIKVAYKESLYAYEKLINLYSHNSVKEIISKMNHTSFQKAFKDIIGIELKEFQLEIDKNIESSSYFPIFLSLPNFLFFISSIIIFIIFIYIKLRNRAIIKKWKLEEEIESLDENNIDHNSN